MYDGNGVGECGILLLNRIYTTMENFFFRVLRTEIITLVKGNKIKKANSNRTDD